MTIQDLFGDDFPFIPPSPTCHPTTLNNAATCISDIVTDKSPAGIQYDSQWEALDIHQGSGIPDFPEGDTCGDHHPGDTLTDDSTLTSAAKETLARDGEKWGPPTQAWTEVGQETSSVGTSQGSSSPTSEKRGTKENLVDEWYALCVYCLMYIRTCKMSVPRLYPTSYYTHNFSNLSYPHYSSYCSLPCFYPSSNALSCCIVHV